MKLTVIFFGLFWFFACLDAHLNIYLNQHEVMRLLGEFMYFKTLKSNNNTTNKI